MNFDAHKTIVCFGDSVTEGCFGLYPTSYGFDTYRAPEKGYVAKLDSLLKSKYGDDKITVINAGVSGNNAPMGLRRIETDVLSHSPDIVVVAFGLNDFFKPVETYEACLCEIFEKIKACGARAVYLTPNMMNTYVHPETVPSAIAVAEKTAAAQNNGTLSRIVQAGKTVAEKFGAAVCDVYLYWQCLYKSGTGTTLLLANLINHPTEEMHTITAKLLLETIESLQ